MNGVVSRARPRPTEAAAAWRRRVVWLAAGTPVLRRARADGLRVVPTGSHWSTWCFFDAVTHRFQGWDVDIEDPHVRDDSATYSRDHVLDVEVEPDRTVWRRDEDELVEAVHQGRYITGEAARITAVADAAGGRRGVGVTVP